MNESPDKKAVDSVKDICAALVRAVSATKIFPAGHDSITQLRNGTFSRLRQFLNENIELELDVKQGSFLFMDEIVHQDDNVLRGLPYFFHKDGMQKLIFLKGLTNEEFSDFLDVIRNISALPVDVGDIVDALWQRDYEHIRYLSPDEFIEAKLSGDQDLPREFDIRKDALYAGAIELAPEDAEDVARRKVELCLKDPLEFPDAGSLFAPLTESEGQSLEDCLIAARRESAEKEFPEMIFEVLNLEDKPEDFTKILASLEPHLHNLTLKLDFTQAVRLLNRLGEVLEVSAPAAGWKGAELDGFYTAVRSRFPLDKIREKAALQRVPNSRSFFEYLKFIGPKALPLGADLFEQVKETEFRNDARPFLEDMIVKAPQALVDLAGQDKPEFAKAVIFLLGQRPDAAMIPYLAQFIATGRKDIKIDAIRILGKFHDASAQERLAALLDNPDEELRIEVMKAIRVVAGGDPARRLSAIASAKGFHKRSALEKEALLKALARSRSKEALDLLLGLIKRSGLFGRAKILESRLCAVRALAAMATPAALSALKSQARRRPKILRMEIRAVLKRQAYI